MELDQAYAAMRKSRGSTYSPRTRHLDENGWALFTNRLFLESSPYLLQHAHNPVNWYPWGEEAFDAARSENRPVLLSVGYATCHWCHVMEEESFEDLEIAAFINGNFIPVKVDREERLDVDSIYMKAVQVLTGRGGWPMTVCLTPEKKPFFGGTYFPARDGDRGVLMGFLTLLKKIRETWDKDYEIIDRSSLQITEALQKTVQIEKGAGLPQAHVIDNAVSLLKQQFDSKNGGISGAPKFPSSMPVSLLLDQYRRKNDKTLLHMADLTLLKMAQGGIYDHAGGGFHRYATDEKWLVPHFEKMLYDNALLVSAYLHGFQVTGNRRFRKVVEETLLYVQRDMTSLDGAFYSATDADSLSENNKSEEGAFFTWTPEELETVLDSRTAQAAALYFNVTPAGNFDGKNILNVNRPLAEVAESLGQDEKAFKSLIEKAKEKLYLHRKNRPTPIRDEKIITAWNGLMISAFAGAGRVLNRPAYVSAARKAALFVLNHLYKDGRLYRSFKDGRAAGHGFLEDYAFFSAGLLDLFQADADSYWLDTAVSLDKIMEECYEDRENGGFFMTAHDQELLMAREKPVYDNALPSGNACAVMNLLRLYAITREAAYQKRAVRAFKAFSKLFESNLPGLYNMVSALDVCLHDNHGMDAAEG